jgi:hypothetical protein
MAAGGQQGTQCGAEYTAGPGDQDTQWPDTAPLMQQDIIVQRGVPVAENPFQGPLHLPVDACRKQGLKGKGILNLVGQQGSLRGIGKAVGMAPGRKRAVLLNITKHHPWLVVDMQGVPMIGKGTGMEPQLDFASRID